MPLTQVTIKRKVFAQILIHVISYVRVYDSEISLRTKISPLSPLATNE